MPDDRDQHRDADFVAAVYIAGSDLVRVGCLSRWTVESKAARRASVDGRNCAHDRSKTKGRFLGPRLHFRPLSPFYRSKVAVVLHSG